jgi:hypothetical protein
MFALLDPRESRFYLFECPTLALERGYGHVLSGGVAGAGGIVVRLVIDVNIAEAIVNPDADFVALHDQGSFNRFVFPVTPFCWCGHL